MRRSLPRQIVRWLSWCAVALCAAYALFGGEYPLQDIAALHIQHRRLVEDSVRLRAIVDSLSHLRDALRSDSATIERIAREKLGFIGENEILYRFVLPDEFATSK